MARDVITKTKQSVRDQSAPNLRGYAAVRAAFTWGSARARLAMDSLDRVAEHINRSSNRLPLALVTLGLYVAGSLLMQPSIGPRLYGDMPALGVLICALALWLTLRIARDRPIGKAVMPKKRDMTPVVDLTREKRTGPVRSRRPVYVDLLPPCNNACPASENIQAWLALAQAGRFRAAWEALVRDNPMPAVHGRVCYHPCETACNREVLDDAVRIHEVERLIRGRSRRV